MANTQRKDVLVLGNFDVTAKAIATGFAYTGTWYNLIDNTTINVTDASARITIEAGGFIVYGNKVASLAIAKNEGTFGIDLLANPASSYFTLKINTTKIQFFSMARQVV